MKIYRIIYFDARLKRRCTKFMQGVSYAEASKPFKNIILGQEIDEEGKVIRTEYRSEAHKEKNDGNSTATSSSSHRNRA